MPKEKGVTTNARGKKSRSKSSRDESKATSVAPISKQPTPPDLSGKYEFICPVVELQRINLQRTMVNHTKSMRKTYLDTRSRLANLNVFTGTYIDKFDDVDSEGRVKEKAYVSTAFRVKMPLNCSQLVKEDSRCASVQSKIKSLMATANTDYEESKIKMSKHANKIGKLEIKARSLILQQDFGTAMREIANGLVLVGLNREDIQSKTNSNTDIAFCAIHVALPQFKQDFWTGLPFVQDSQEGIEKFTEELDASYGIDFDGDIKGKFAPTQPSLEAANAAAIAGTTAAAVQHPYLRLVT